MSDNVDRVSERIADGLAIDWQDVESSAGSGDEREWLQCLQIVAHIADAHRSSQPHERNVETAESSSAETLASDHRPFTGTARFEVRRQLGSGSFGTVFEAYDRHQLRPIAVKVLRRSDPAFLLRFKREFRALVDVRHPNLTELYELFFEDGLWFFTMELIRGGNFLRHVECRPRLRGEQGPIASNLDRLRPACGQLAAGIAALHDLGIVHRDIKPANVLVSTHDGRLRLLDFGLLSETGHQGLQTVLVGTPAYMSPEQAKGLEAREASDWYSFGVILFQALTGFLPPPPLQRRLRDDAQIRPASFVADVPPDLESLCRALLQLDPAERPDRCEVLDRLNRMPPSPHGVELKSATESVLVSREAELATLQRALDATKHGRTVVVSLSGKSGIGKTSLLQAFARRLASDQPDVVVLQGRCHESETVPFKALDNVIDNLSRYLSDLSETEAAALAPRDVQYLVPVFPVLGHARAITWGHRQAGPIADIQELRRRAFLSLQDLMSRLAERKVVVIVIDDLQWGDLDSGAFMGSLLSAAAPPSLLFIASYRTEDLESSPFLQAWRRHLASATAIDRRDLAIAEFTQAESRDLVRRLLGSEFGPDDAAVDAIARESAGSPFLIDQLVQYLRTTRVSREGDTSLQHAIETRVAGLAGQARPLLESIAVAGQPLLSEIANRSVGLPPHDSSHLPALLGARLVRVRETGGPREVEVYHDQIRTAILASMPAALRVERHRGLAEAFEAHGGVDPAVLAIHFQEAGDQVNAIRYMSAAADHAMSALAFDRAAHWYSRLLNACRWAGAERTAVQRKLAHALTQAARPAEAADVYLAAAAETKSVERFELQRLAAEQLLRCGRVNDGLRTLHGVANELGVWLPSTRYSMMASLLWHRLKISLSPLDSAARQSDIPREEIITLDVYWSLVVGLATLDVTRSVEYQSRHLLRALSIGDSARLAMSLSAEAAYRASSSQRDAPRIDDMFARATGLVAGTSHPQAPGFVAVMRGVAYLLSGDWPHAYESSEVAEGVLKQRCTGVTWETATNTLVQSTAIALLGHYTALDPIERLDRIHKAAAAHDVYAVHASAASVHVVCLARHLTDLARAFVNPVRDALSASTSTEYLLPQLWLLEARADTALYERDVQEAWRLLSQDWSSLTRSMHLRVEYASNIAHYLRGRTAVAMAAVDSGAEARHLSEARRCARRLARSRARFGQAFSEAILAGIASVERRHEEARRRLSQAATTAAQVSMPWLATACEYQRRVLDGDPSGAAGSFATPWDDLAIVAEPSRFFDLWVPGVWSSNP